MPRLIRLFIGISFVLAFGCGRSDPSGARATDYDLVQVVLDDSAAQIQLVERSSRVAVLYVDATCPNSLYALEQTLADSVARSKVVLQYYPQVLRDPVARFETVALECARRSGSLDAYVTQRLDDAARGPRSVEMSASSIGLDTRSFMACVASDTVDAFVSRQERLAIAAGIQLLPALVYERRTIVGRDNVVRSLSSLPR